MVLALSSAWEPAVAEGRQPWKLDGAAERIERFRKGTAKLQFVLPDGSEPNNALQVDIELKKHDFLFGVSMSQSWALFELPHFERYRHYIGELFNGVTLGFFWNAMEWKRGQLRSVVHTESNLKWAKSRGMTLKGMPLLWHNALPKWLDHINDPDEVDRLIADRIRHLVKTYPDINMWGAYNEAVGALKPHMKDNAVIRWLTGKGGPAAAQVWVLKTAQATVSGKRYINNHYDHKDPAFKKLNHELIANDAQFDAIGIQTHMHTQAKMLNERQLWDLLEEYADFGKPLQLTEVTVLSSEPFESWRDLGLHYRAIKKAQLKERPAMARPSTLELEHYQESYIKDFYTLSFSHPAVEAIIYWSVSDLNEWRGSAGGLLDVEHNPKPAYYALKSLIKDVWHTKVKSRTDKGGKLIFRGFFGEYLGTATMGDLKFTFGLIHSPDHKGIYNIQLSQESQGL